MKRKLLAIFALIIILSLNLSLVSSASEYIYGVIPEERIVPLVADNADLLSDDEEAELNSILDSIGSFNEVEIGIVTVTSLEGKSAQAFADDYYDYNGFGYGANDDGLLVLYKDGATGDREIYITTHGSAIYRFSDRRINEIIDEMIPWIMSGSYYYSFVVFADECEYTLENYSASSSVSIGGRAVPIVWIPGSIAIGFLIAFVIMLCVASSLKTVRRKVNAASYVDNMNLTDKRDTFIFKNVRKTPIPKSTSSSSSSTHRSSSGRSHGGGGRRF